MFFCRKELCIGILHGLSYHFIQHPFSSYMLYIRLNQNSLINPPSSLPPYHSIVFVIKQKFEASQSQA